jgi:predicted PurR-regulated permease PerM
MVSAGVMLYLLFFLLRDGPIVFEKIRLAIPLHPEHKRHLFSKFTTVVRATVKGNIAIAALQGTLGGVIFAFLAIPGAVLWGTVMAFLSLLPAIGAALIWGPVAIYFLLTDAIWEGTVLVVFGVLVIGLVDNVLRPILVGADTQIPDYLVLISTLGGLVLFGVTGFVIGPVIAALFIAAWDLFSSNRQVQ